MAGPGNRIAHAAATEMAQSAGRSFNPLLIHSGIGLGKTHLLEGIHHGLKHSYPGIQIVQLTAEKFTNSFLDSMRAGTLNGFRARFRTAGGLIVDDIQFLAAKRATMAEFLYTFDALFDKGAPIVLAADQHPREISRLTEELVTRFLAGMVARIESPDLATRQAILKLKAAAHGVEVPDAVLAYIADRLRASIREIEALFTPSSARPHSSAGGLTSLSLSLYCVTRFATQPSRWVCAISSGRSATCSRSKSRRSGRKVARRPWHTPA